MAGRRLGQHFLARKSILEQIAVLAAPQSSPAIIEIGPGRGALTEHLLSRTERLVAIEVDQVLVHYLLEKFRGQSNFTVLNIDVLKADLRQWGPVSVVGNLPYYITSPIVERVLTLGPLLRNAVFLVQKEVAERITAKPGSREYGYLSVQVQVLASAQLVLQVPPEAFRPPPKVDSAVVQLMPHAQPFVPDTPAFLKFASAAFRQKRKTLRNNLLALYPREAVDAQPEAKLRAEQLSVVELANLQDRILKFR